MKFLEFNGRKVFYEEDLKGGGDTFGQQYLSVVKKLFGHVGTVFEWCSGCGFIGFSLLASGLCDRLVLADINPDAIKCMRKTAEANGWNLYTSHLERPQVTIYLSDNLKSIPSTERFDLVVGNPPHFKTGGGRKILTDDPEWGLHRDFYREIHKFLNPYASVLIQENYHGSNENDFIHYIATGGLLVRDIFMEKIALKDQINPYYFIWSELPKDVITLYHEVVDVGLHDDNGDVIELRAYRPYAFHLMNPYSIRQVIRMKNNDRIFYGLKPLADVAAHSEGYSSILSFTPGEFVLFSTKTYVRIRVI